MRVMMRMMIMMIMMMTIVIALMWRKYPEKRRRISHRTPPPCPILLDQERGNFCPFFLNMVFFFCETLLTSSPSYLSVRDFSGESLGENSCQSSGTWGEGVLIPRGRGKCCPVFCLDFSVASATLVLDSFNLFNLRFGG